MMNISSLAGFQMRKGFYTEIVWAHFSTASLIISNTRYGDRIAIILSECVFTQERMSTLGLIQCAQCWPPLFN